MPFAREIAITRYQAKGWTKAEFIRKVCRHDEVRLTANTQAVRAHLSGQVKNPTLPYMKAMADVLGCTVDDLMREP